MVRVNHRETAEDLVQETFVSAIRSIEGFRAESSEITWLTAILKNKITDYYRKKDILKGSVEYLETTDLDFSKNFFDTGNGHWLPEAAPQLWSEPADASMDKAEFNKVLEMCVQKMPARLAPVFIARFFNEEDSEKICKDHGISSSNYWVIIHRAKVLVRSCIEKNWFLTKR